MEKPIPLEAYRCPVCDVVIFGTREEAQRHVSIPVVNPLPKGFIFRENCAEPEMHIEDSYLVIDEVVEMQKEERKHPFADGRFPAHSYVQRLYQFSPSFRFIGNGAIKCSTFMIEGFKTGQYRLLSVEEFEEAGKEIINCLSFWHPELIRFPKELEGIVAETVLVH